MTHEEIRAMARAAYESTDASTDAYIEAALEELSAEEKEIFSEAYESCFLAPSDSDLYDRGDLAFFESLVPSDDEIPF